MTLENYSEVIIKNDTEYFFDREHQLHRTDGPAVISRNLHHVKYYIHGSYYSDKASFKLKIKQLTKLHKKETAMTTPMQKLQKFEIGYHHVWGTEAPVDNKEQWFINGSGNKCCYFNKRLHCSSGPAYIGLDGSYRYYEDGAEHCLSGPAAVDAYGNQSYWIHGVKYASQADWAKAKVGLTTDQELSAKFKSLSDARPLVGKIATIDGVEYTLS